jgi:dihydroorotase
MKPPLRSHCDIEVVTKGIATGIVDALATDHAPHPGSEKMQEFEKCPFGITGLETAVGLTLEKLVTPGVIDRGTLTLGKPADITILHTAHEWTYDVNRSLSKSRNSPFDGHLFHGGPVAAIVDGAFVWRRDEEEHGCR